MRIVAVRASMRGVLGGVIERVRAAASGDPVYALAQADRLSPLAYERLFVYFAHGFMLRRSARGAHARYRGWPSFNGARCDAMEGFSRIAPLLAAWLHAKRPREVVLEGCAVDLAEVLRAGLVNGTDAASSEYWGRIRHLDQRIVEAADLALALWLTRESVWPALTHAQRGAVVDWLSGVNGKETADNNWHLFVVLVNAVLLALDAGGDRDEMARRYARFKSFYRGDGWFSDGPHEKFDYYIAWGIHYPLHWLRRIDPGWDASFLHRVQCEFASWFRFLFGPYGFPILGRSVCYRMAAPAPLVQIQLTEPDCVSPGEARRALDLTWSYFLRLGAVRDGTPTQGYGAEDPRMLDNYSGPASCLWSLRSLVAAFALPQDCDFWRSPGEPLPVEREDFKLVLSVPGWALSGNAATADVVIERKSGYQNAADVLQAYPAWRRIVDRLLRRARRPGNVLAKYELRRYSSAQPFCGLGRRDG
jgi:hypothetical protein